MKAGSMVSSHPRANSGVPSSFTSASKATTHKSASKESETFTAPSERLPVATNSQLTQSTCLSCSKCQSCSTGCPCNLARRRLNKLEKEVANEQTEHRRTQEELARATREIQLLREIIEKKMTGEGSSIGSRASAVSSQKSSSVMRNAK